MQTVESLQLILKETLRAPVEIELGRSRTKPVQARSLRAGTFARSGVALRLHRIFLEAPDSIVADMGQWLRSGRRAKHACERLDGWMNAALAAAPAPAPRRVRLAPEGDIFHLGKIQLDVVDTDLHGRFPFQASPEVAPIELPDITWGRESPRKRPRTLRLGSYQGEPNLIRIHPRLDREAVPERFVRYIVFHELLHALYPSRRNARGHWIHHTREFRAREAAYPDYEFALQWEKEHLFRVLRG